MPVVLYPLLKNTRDRTTCVLACIKISFEYKTVLFANAQGKYVFYILAMGFLMQGTSHTWPGFN